MTVMAQSGIARFEVHPAIGIARLGKSKAFFFGPEPLSFVKNYWHSRKYEKKPPEEPESIDKLDSMRCLCDYRDEHRALKRQAVRFRVYRVWRNDDGKI